MPFDSSVYFWGRETQTCVSFAIHACW